MHRRFAAGESATGRAVAASEFNAAKAGRARTFAHACEPAEATVRKRLTDTSPRLGLVREQRIAREAQVLDDAPTDQVFLDNALGVLGRDIAIPRPFRVNDADGPPRADPEALALGPIEGSVGPGNVQFLHPALQIHPRSLAVLQIGAIRPETDEQMTRQPADAEQRG